MVTEEKGFEPCFEGQGTPEKGDGATGYKMMPLPLWLNSSFLDVHHFS